MLRVNRCAKSIGSTPTAFASVVLERLSGMIALPLLVVVGFVLRPSLLHVQHAWFALLVSAITLGTLGLILFAAGHPGIAGRFATNENWTRFIGAVFQGIDRAGAIRARSCACSSPRSCTSCRSSPRTC